MNYTIEEIGGKLYKVFPFGNKLAHTPENPLLNGLPASPGVYMITQVSTGLNYIGSSKDVKARCAGYLRSGAAKKSGKRMNEVLKTEIKFTLLEQCDCVDKEYLTNRELYFIEKFNTIHPNGFNAKCPVTNKRLCKDKMVYNYRNKTPYSGFKVSGCKKRLLAAGN